MDWSGYGWSLGVLEGLKKDQIKPTSFMGQAGEVWGGMKEKNQMVALLMGQIRPQNLSQKIWKIEKYSSNPQI